MKTINPPMKQLEMKGKRQELREQITHLVYRLGSGARLPRVTEMCRDFNVAPNTLNHALRQVEEEGLIRRQQGVGIFVNELTDNWLSQAPLALVCQPSFFRSSGHSPVWDLLLEMFQAHAEKSGTPFDCHFSRAEGVHPPLAAAFMNAIENREIGGVLGVGLPQAGATWIMSHGVPVVNLFGPGNVSVMLDEVGLINTCVDTLVRQGCRKIALWMPIHVDGIINQTQTRFEEALRAHKLEVFTELIDIGEGWIHELSRNVPPVTEQGLQTALRFFERPRDEWPDGVVIGDDTMTRGALMALRQLKLKAGRDVLIASHANAGSPTLMGEEGLSLVEIDPAEMVSAMFERIERLMHSPLSDPKKEEVINISARLRHST